MLQNLPNLLVQTIAHLQSMIFFVDPSEYEKAEKGCVLAEAIQTVVRSRVFFDGLNLPGSEVQFDDKSTVRILADAGVRSDLHPAELIEIFYVPISNAHRIMGQQENPGDLRMDITAKEISYEGQTVLVLEVFNTGKLVDLTELQRQLVSVNEKSLRVVGGGLDKIVAAIKSGSKQAHLSADEGVLILDGLTLTRGGTGLGLSDMHRQIDMTGGALLLNNVYTPGEEGFCVTVLLPQGDSSTSKDPNGIKSTLRKLKELLQSGECFLEDLVVNEVACG